MTKFSIHYLCDIIELSAQFEKALTLSVLSVICAVVTTVLEGGGLYSMVMDKETISGTLEVLGILFIYAEDIFFALAVLLVLRGYCEVLKKRTGNDPTNRLHYLGILYFAGTLIAASLNAYASLLWPGGILYCSVAFHFMCTVLEALMCFFLGKEVSSL